MYKIMNENKTHDIQHKRKPLNYKLLTSNMRIKIMAWLKQFEVINPPLHLDRGVTVQLENKLLKSNEKGVTNQIETKKKYV